MQRPISKYLFANFFSAHGSHPTCVGLPRRPVPAVIKAALRMEVASPSTLPQIAYSNVFAKNFSPTGAYPSRTLPVNHKALNRFRFFARIARCIAVIGGTGGCLHGGGACRCAFVLCGAEVCRGPNHSHLAKIPTSAVDPVA